MKRGQHQLAPEFRIWNLISAGTSTNHPHDGYEFWVSFVLNQYSDVGVVIK
jgi:hypothetical protein